LSNMCVPSEKTFLVVHSFISDFNISYNFRLIPSDSLLTLLINTPPEHSLHN
jgi:hypothetical protein